CQQYYSDPYSF
nr:immunoglobulin light chain junction region [Macaca mulatta]MOV82551.1 immunoglobulin light chain junction region [Macaca mulatta]MOV85952.1 immunoglobulin light chain junction region [Macaca mulatta]MOW62227.1 immunoglobulin light chain junction region [Macaca mulatta]MOW63922.1 immunoglobulin light chain junction region [Macaca mulatta]